MSGRSERRYSMDDLLHLVHSDGADELRLRVGQPPVIVLEGEQQPLEGLAITTEHAEQLLHSITDTRQRRELREHGVVEFIYRFRGRASFVIRATMEDENVGMDIH
jgi:Tfp pilus assembly ATPase PilU